MGFMMYPVNKWQKLEMEMRHLDTQMLSCYNHREAYIFFDICPVLEEIILLILMLSESYSRGKESGIK